MKVDSVPASGTTVYMYYGNPRATLSGPYANNGKNTFEMFDDFRGGAIDSTLWNTGTTGTGAVLAQQSGWLHTSATCCNFSGSSVSLKTVPTVAGAHVAEFNMMMNNSPNNLSWKSDMWCGEIGPSASVATSPVAAGCSGWWSNGLQSCAPVNGTNLGKIEVDAAAGTFKLYLGSTLCRAASGVSLTSPYVFYLLTAGDGLETVDLADFRVRPFASPEPVAGPPGPEQP